ncbi:hypothetical protein Tco_1294465 [Tanacetum coccineum]
MRTEAYISLLKDPGLPEEFQRRLCELRNDRYGTRLELLRSSVIIGSGPELMRTGAIHSSKFSFEQPESRYQRMYVPPAFENSHVFWRVGIFRSLNLCWGPVGLADTVYVHVTGCLVKGHSSPIRHNFFVVGSSIDNPQLSFLRVNFFPVGFSMIDHISKIVYRLLSQPAWSCSNCYQTVCLLVAKSAWSCSNCYQTVCLLVSKSASFIQDNFNSFDLLCNGVETAYSIEGIHLEIRMLDTFLVALHVSCCVLDEVPGLSLKFVDLKNEEYWVDTIVNAEVVLEIWSQPFFLFILSMDKIFVLGVRFLCGAKSISDIHGILMSQYNRACLIGHDYTDPDIIERLIRSSDERFTMNLVCVVGSLIHQSTNACIDPAFKESSSKLVTVLLTALVRGILRACADSFAVVTHIVFSLIRIHIALFSVLSPAFPATTISFALFPEMVFLDYSHCHLPQSYPEQHVLECSIGSLCLGEFGVDSFLSTIDGDLRVVATQYDCVDTSDFDAIRTTRQ